ncbi:MAG: transglutaminase family protein [Thermoanaerobaculia bacterium]|nr:transglutaminase family protein [Thermoanaerobaculia bacterium]
MRILIQHKSRYDYREPAALGPQVIRLRPANHAKARVESYSLNIEPGGEIRWQQDPYGNHIARVTYKEGTRVPSFSVLVEIAAEIRPVNPFDFFLDEWAENFPFTYPPEVRQDLLPFLDLKEPETATGPLFEEFFSHLKNSGPTVELLVELNQAVNRRIRYVIREETGIWSPETTLAEGRGSCRDSSVLLVTVLRRLGFAARFVSGYLVQLTDEGMIPDEPKGVSHDVADLHAWTEVYLPGAGWIGLDATSGLMCGEGHIPLAATASPRLAAPLEGTSDSEAANVTFEMKIGRLGHEPRPTRPYTDEVWAEVLKAGERVDEKLLSQGVVLTMGGEPTFNSREHPDEPEWNSAALGPTKWTHARRLARALRDRLAPGGLVFHRTGKLYPGESMPRWALDVIGRRDQEPIWTEREEREAADLGTARFFSAVLALRLGLSRFLVPAFEDPWHFLSEEARVPVDIDPLREDLKDPEERRRLAKVLNRGLRAEAGYVLPLVREGDGWRSEHWTFRRRHLFLIPGESPIGLRLPLGSLGPGFIPEPPEAESEPPDPRRELPRAERKRRLEAARQPQLARHRGVRTALCVEEREGRLFVFLPPVARAEDFLALVRVVNEAAARASFAVELEGYPPPSSPDLTRFSVTPDPGVLEVNIPPTESFGEHNLLFEKVFDAALHAGLHSEKYLLDGRLSGSGGGNHFTFGGRTPLESPFVKFPDLLASLLTFTQHHPSLSYLFAGLFIGPTSEAPRVDEARHESLYELEIALEHAFGKKGEPVPPWLSDSLFRHLLVDLSGNTHRAEISIDKLFDPATAHGRQGLVEFRAFEMPPHPRMVSAQALLLRSLLTAFLEAPYQGELVRWGQALHDRFLLPHYLWRDFEDVLSYLGGRGLPLPEEAYRAFLELRCPVAGRTVARDVMVEVRNALEPWMVLGEELTSYGTARFVDSSIERIEVRVEGLVPERHAVLVNGHLLPMRPTGTAGEFVGGVRFRAWAPAHSLHAHLGIHHPVKLDVLDTWAKRSLGACAYHVWHPEGRAFETAPLTKFEASARRAQRFTVEGAMPYPAGAGLAGPRPACPHPDAPYTLDLRRLPLDRPMPRTEEEE